MQISSIPSNPLHSGHFAFMRAIIEGMDITSSWNRYLRFQERHSTPKDVQRVKRQIKDALNVALKHHSFRSGVMRTRRFADMRSRTSPGASPDSMDLEEFVLKNDLVNFSEAEQLHAYQQHHSYISVRSTPKARRIALQLAALDWLQQHQLVMVPRSSDLISAWMDARLANRLAIADLIRLSQLVQYINRNGPRWWVSIPGIGIAKAMRIIDWLHTHTDKFEQTLESHVLDPVIHCSASVRRHHRPNATAIVPLEKLIIPQSVLMRPPKLRAHLHECLIPARDDIEALRIWIHAKRPVPNQHRVKKPVDATCCLPPSVVSANRDPGWEVLQAMSNTQRAYWKEAERFLLWLVLERGITLSSIDESDCKHYLAFLQHPLKRWCGVRGHEKGDASWRPFEKALAPAAQHRTMKILRSMVEFLVLQRYLIENPWDGFLKKLPTPSPLPIPYQTRRFDALALEVIHQQLAKLTAASSELRLRTAILLFLDSGASIGELVRARTADIASDSTSTDLPQASRRLLTVTPHTLAVLQTYFASRGLNSDLYAPDNANAMLLGHATATAQRAPWAPWAKKSLDPTVGISVGSLRDQLKQFFMQCMDACGDQPTLTMQFARATSHWLRR